MSDNRVPDKAWLVVVLSTLDPDHLIFKKDYMADQKQEKRENKTVNNSDGFFDNLPTLRKTKDTASHSKVKEF